MAFDWVTQSSLEMASIKKQTKMGPGEHTESQKHLGNDA